MLIPSKNKNEKIVLGLLSYTFNEDINSLEQRELLEAYRENSNQEIYLYKENDNENYIGVIVIETAKLKDTLIVDSVTIERIALIPSYREEGIGYQMYLEIRELFPNATIQGSILMSEVVKNWSIKYREEQD